MKKNTVIKSILSLVILLGAQAANSATCGGVFQPACPETEPVCGTEFTPPCPGTEPVCGTAFSQPCPGTEPVCGTVFTPPCPGTEPVCGGAFSPPCETVVVECGTAFTPACGDEPAVCGTAFTQPCDDTITSCGGPFEPVCDTTVGNCGGPFEPVCDDVEPICGTAFTQPCGVVVTDPVPVMNPSYTPGTVTILHSDALGSPVAATDVNGYKLWTESYEAYGEKRVNSVAAEGESFAYTGHTDIKETGLVYMGARYYDPVIGRFMAMDPAGVNPEDPRTFNRYAYANNNPYKYTDPDGRSPKGLLDRKGWGPEFTPGGFSGAGARGHTKINFSKIFKNLFSSQKSTSSFLRNKLKRINNQTAAGGNRGVTGSVSNEQAIILGKKFVGSDFKTMSNGKGLVSADGLKTFRFPAAKKGTNPATGEPWSKTGTQVNFETKAARGEAPISNVHLDVN